MKQKTMSDSSEHGGSQKRVTSHPVEILRVDASTAALALPPPLEHENMAKRLSKRAISNENTDSQTSEMASESQGTAVNSESQLSETVVADESQETDAFPESQDVDLIVDSKDSARRVSSLPDPFVPLTESYTYHSPTPTASGPYMLGVDEAGRGPVLGPMVYGVAYCPVAYKDDLEELGFADSKTLSHDSRSGLLDILSSDPSNLGWSVRVLSPQAISSGMLRRPPVNLNQQSQDATVLLIRDVLNKGMQLTEVYVDALGNTTTYERYLSSMFPGIQFTVTAKADSKFKIVGAASIAAKVTRDAWISGWAYEEHESNPQYTWSEELGSGYPSDPKTQAWLKDSVEPTFGFPSIARFSWGTTKVALEKHAHAVQWIDEGQTSLVKAFEGAKGHDKGRCSFAKDLALRTVNSL